MRHGQDRPPASMAGSITAGWDAGRAETFAGQGFRARGICGRIRTRAEGADGAALEPATPAARAADAVPTR